MKSISLRVAMAFAFTLMIGTGQTVLAEHTDGGPGVPPQYGPEPIDESNLVSDVGTALAGCEEGDYVTVGKDADTGELYLQCSHFPGGGPCPKGQYVVLHHHDGPACAKWTGQMNKPNG